MTHYAVLVLPSLLAYGVLVLLAKLGQQEVQRLTSCFCEGGLLLEGDPAVIAVAD